LKVKQKSAHPECGGAKWKETGENIPLRVLEFSKIPFIMPPNHKKGGIE
jgi:hypothetical protein